MTRLRAGAQGASRSRCLPQNAAIKMADAQPAAPRTVQLHKGKWTPGAVALQGAPAVVAPAAPEDVWKLSHGEHESLDRLLLVIFGWFILEFFIQARGAPRGGLLIRWRWTALHGEAAWAHARPARCLLAARPSAGAGPPADPPADPPARRLA